MAAAGKRPAAVPLSLEAMKAGRVVRVGQEPVQKRPQEAQGLCPKVHLQRRRSLQLLLPHRRPSPIPSSLIWRRSEPVAGVLGS